MMSAYNTVPSFLLTNDDGIFAPGLWAAARALLPLGRVTVIAPTTNQSGRGTSLPPVRELPVMLYDGVPEDLKAVTAYALPGTPAACVQVGLSGALTHGPIQMVVSGINDSYNLGRDVVYSGTVGAALTAHLRGVPALAASFGGGTAQGAHWETATWAVQEVARNMMEATAMTPPLMNLNIPDLPLHEIPSIEITSLSTRTLLDRYEITLSEPNLLRMRPLEESAPRSGEPASDIWAVERGYLSLTPLQLFPDILCVASWGQGALSYRGVPAEATWSMAQDAR
jgi:5'-nucleotidase